MYGNRCFPLLRKANVGAAACRFRVCIKPTPLLLQVDGIGNLVELNGRFAAELDAPVLMVSC